MIQIGKYVRLAIIRNQWSLRAIFAVQSMKCYYSLYLIEGLVGWVSYYHRISSSSSSIHCSFGSVSGRLDAQDLCLSSPFSLKTSHPIISKAMIIWCCSLIIHSQTLVWLFFTTWLLIRYCTYFYCYYYYLLLLTILLFHIEVEKTTSVMDCYSIA